MRIIQILHGELMIGGMEKFCLDLSNELSKEHDVILFTDECYNDLISDRVHYVPFDIHKSRNNLIFLYKLYKQIESFNPDIIHAHKQKSIQILKRLKPFLNVPYVVTKHDIKKKKAFYGIDYAITISEETTPTIQAKHIYKICNGVPYVEPKKINMPEAFNIVAVGGLKTIKDFGTLIRAVSSLPFKFHLTIVGEGVLRKEFEALILELGLKDKVSLVGLKSNVQDYLYSSDLQVISSIAEGFSLVVAEGVFYSKRIISTKVGISNELLPEICLYDIENLTEKINDVYKDQEKYKLAFDEVKKNYKDQLTMNTCMKNHIDVYKKIIENYKIRK